jgi:hypothetical protein
MNSLITPKCNWALVWQSLVIHFHKKKPLYQSLKNECFIELAVKNHKLLNTAEIKKCDWIS